MTSFNVYTSDGLSTTTDGKLHHHQYKGGMVNPATG